MEKKQKTLPLPQHEKQRLTNGLRTFLMEFPQQLGPEIVDHLSLADVCNLHAVVAKGVSRDLLLSWVRYIHWRGGGLRDLWTGKNKNSKATEAFLHVFFPLLSAGKFCRLSSFCLEDIDMTKYSMHLTSLVGEHVGRLRRFSWIRCECADTGHICHVLDTLRHKGVRLESLAIVSLGYMHTTLDQERSIAAYLQTCSNETAEHRPVVVDMTSLRLSSLGTNRFHNLGVFTPETTWLSLCPWSLRHLEICIDPIPAHIARVATQCPSLDTLVMDGERDDQDARWTSVDLHLLFASCRQLSNLHLAGRCGTTYRWTRGRDQRDLNKWSLRQTEEPGVDANSPKYATQWEERMPQLVCDAILGFPPIVKDGAQWASLELHLTHAFDALDMLVDRGLDEKNQPRLSCDACTLHIAMGDMRDLGVFLDVVEPWQKDSTWMDRLLAFSSRMADLDILLDDVHTSRQMDNVTLRVSLNRSEKTLGISIA